LTRLRLPFIAIALALLASGLVAACGSSSSSSEDPQQALKETFNNPKSITSGNLDLSLSADVSGSQSGNFTAAITGPFESSTDKTKFPQLDLTAKVSGQGTGTPSISFEGGLIATNTDAFVSYQGTDYQIPSSLYQQFTAQYAQQQQLAQQSGASSKSASSLFKQLGIDPSTWLTNVSNDGTADVGGVTTIHISGDADVAKIVSDLSQVAQQIPNASTQIPSGDQLKQVEDAVKTASVDVYTGEDDHLLRKLDLSLEIAPPAGATSSGIDSVKIDFSLTLNDVNQPQTITAPANSKPLSDLTSQLGGLGALGALGGGSSSIPSIPSTGSSSSGLPSTGGSSSSQQYIQCALNAQGNQAAINACAQKFLGQ
jgi:hypothetical protein